MRRLLFAIGMLTLCTACVKDDIDEDKILLTETAYNWDTSVRQQDIQINATGMWTVASDVSWCEPRKKSGSGKTTLNLWVEPNLTSEARTGKLTVRANGTIRTINIAQPACTSPDDYEYHLPVIFHVLYKDRHDEQQYVREGWLSHLLDSVNMVYRDNNAKVQFEMSEYDEDGNKLDEAGVMRHEVNFDSYDCYDFISSSDEKNRTYGRYNQNLRKFINIFVYKFSTDSIGGISCPAIMPTGYELDSLITNDFFNNYTTNGYPWGCCINNAFIYETTNPTYYNTPVYKTIAHELGHYLGLLHTFSYDECNEDDACTDTENYDREAYMQYVNNYINTLSPGQTGSLDYVIRRYECETGKQYDAHNIMDYDFCYSDQLTRQQNARIKHVLNYAMMTPGPKLYTPTRTRNSEPGSPLLPKIQRCPPVTVTSPIRRGTYW